MMKMVKFKYALRSKDYVKERRERVLKTTTNAFLYDVFGDVNE